MKQKNLPLFEKLYPLYAGFSMDLLFWIAIDTLFLTYVKNFSTAEIVSLTGYSMLACVVVQLPLLALIRKIGNTLSIQIGSFFVLASALLITFGKSFLVIFAGRICYEIGMTLTNMINVALKNNLDLLGHSDRYIALRSQSNTVYAAATMIIAFIAGPLYNLNPYLPMAGCIFFCVLTALGSLLMGDGKEAAEGIAAAKKSEKKKVRWGVIPLLAATSYTLFFPIVNSGQGEGKLFIQNMLAEGFDEENVVLLISGMLIISRIVRTVANLFFEKIHKRLGDSVGLFLALMLLLSIASLLAGNALPVPLLGRFAVMGFGYIILLFIRDPLKVYAQAVVVKKVSPDDLPTCLTLMDMSRKILRAVMSLGFTALVAEFSLIYEIWILLALALFEVGIAAALWIKLKGTTKHSACDGRREDFSSL